MNRYTSKVTRVEYAGRVLYSGEDQTQSLAEFWSISRQYSTEATEVVDAVAPLIRSFGNAGGSFPLSVCVDCRDEEEAFGTALECVDWTDQHNTGELVITAGGKVRVTLSFSFVLGARLNLEGE